MRRLVLFGLLLTGTAFSVKAQGGAAPAAPNDSLFKRARRMVGEGNGMAGRAMVDSLLKRAEEGTTAYGDALYWRGALAATAADAERDYRRVIVEYPLSHYADDALLAIVELEQARGERASALAHLQRFVREHPVSPARGVAALAAARLAFDQRDTRTGCSLIGDARASASAGDVELRNQIDYFTARCTGVTADASAPVPVASTRAVTQRDSVPATSAAKKSVTESTTKAATPTPSPARPAAVMQRTEPTTKARGLYTIQLAAYATRPLADALVAKLGSHGVKARVSGNAKPFRVRLDFYPTHQAAQAEVAALKQRGIIGFVTEEPASAGKSP